MTRTFFLIIILLLFNIYESRLISVFGLINQGPSIPSNIEDEYISKQIYPFVKNNLIPNGMTLHIELGTILKTKYIESQIGEYGNFSKTNDFGNKIKIYSSSSPEALQSALGEAIGFFPNFTPHIIKIDEHGHSTHLLEKETVKIYGSEIENLKNLKFSNKTEIISNYSSNDKLIEYFSKTLDVVLNSEKCLKFKDEENNKISKNKKNNIDLKICKNKTLNNSYTAERVLISDEDFVKILSLKNTFPEFFLSKCSKIKCKDDSSFRDLEFIHNLYKQVKLVRDFQVNVKIKDNKMKNNKRMSKISNSIHQILFKYHILHLYNHEEKVSKQIATPLFRFVNGFLENSKSIHCNIKKITENSNTTLIQEPEFLELKILKPVDIMRQIINNSKCKKVVLMVSENHNLVSFIKTLFYYEDIINKVIEASKIDNSEFKKIINLMDPQPTNSFIFQIHQDNSDENNFYVRIFYNLEEISNLPFKIKINYVKDKGIIIDNLVNFLNENSDSNIKYKDSCSN